MLKDTERFNALHKSFRESIRLDSLKLRIPVTLIDIFDEDIPKIWEHSKTDTVTGEMTHLDFKRYAKEYNTDTVPIKVAIEMRNTTEGKTEEVLTILINSKHLKQKYFEGLTIDNIKFIYDEIMSLNAFGVQYENFLRSACTDIDLKLDEIMNQPEWTELLNQFKLVTKPSAELGGGYKSYKPTKENPLQNGLQYGVRKHATPKRPFLKLYWKGGELLSNSLDFREKYLSEYTDEELKRIVRLETTIKNKKHAQTFGIDNVTLLGLLSLTETQKDAVFRQMFSKHLNRPKRQVIVQKVEKANQLSPADHVLYFAIVSNMELTKGTHTEVIEAIISGIEGKVARSRMKTRLNSIYERFIKGSDTDLRVEKVNSFFSKFGWVE